MFRQIKLMKGWKLGNKRLKKGTVIELDRMSMNRLITKGIAIPCSSKGLPLPIPEESKPKDPGSEDK